MKILRKYWPWMSTKKHERIVEEKIKKRSDQLYRELIEPVRAIATSVLYDVPIIGIRTNERVWEVRLQIKEDLALKAFGEADRAALETVSNLMGVELCRFFVENLQNLRRAKEEHEKRIIVPGRNRS